MVRRTHRLVLSGVSVLLGLLVGRPEAANAASQASTVQVSTSVSPSCTIGTAAIAFSPYDPVNANANLTSTSTFVNYEVYKETGRTSIWGAGDGGTVRSGADLNGTGNVVAVTMYGRIPPAQLSAIAGVYNDTLVSTINF